MKRIFVALFVLLVILSTTFANGYRISNAEFDVTGAGFTFLGKTTDYSILSKFPLDKKTVFDSAELLEKYLENYKSKLLSSRAFEEVELSYETSFSNNDDIENVIVKFVIQDSHHLLILPLGKYSSNTGLSAKIKAKDTNFLGSLNTLNADFNVSISNEDGVEPGISFSYDYPFKFLSFDIEWVNSYDLGYSFNEKSLEWAMKTGLTIKKQFNRIAYVLGLYQYFYKDLSYVDYKDDLYFADEISFSTPITLGVLSNYTNLYYTPSISYIFNWDFDGISKDNDDLSSPIISFTHSLSNSNIIWNDFFRNGYSINLSNSYSYNLQRKDFTPSVSFETQLFYTWKTFEEDYWDRFGINIDFYTFHYFDLDRNSYYYGEKIGDRLRGILDDNYFGNITPEYTSSTAVVLNLELPVHIFTTNFEKDLFNFNLQFSPFFDMALYHDRIENTWFSFKGGAYCAGLEILIYPLKWSSYTLRASYGIDLKSAIREEHNILESLSKHKELFIGVGLQF